MKDTTALGNVTEGMLLAALLGSGRIVLLPFGSQPNFDLVIQIDGRFATVQCKTGRIRDGAVSFKAYTVVYDSKSGKYINRAYGNAVDFFGVYCPDNGKSYLVPSRVVTKTECRLRIEPAKNNQAKRVRWAKDYQLCG